MSRFNRIPAEAFFLQETQTRDGRGRLTTKPLNAYVSQLPTSHSSTHNTPLSVGYVGVRLCRGPWAESETQTVSTTIGKRIWFKDTAGVFSARLSEPGSDRFLAEKTFNRAQTLSACI